MKSADAAASKRLTSRKRKIDSPDAQTGLILLDLSLNLMGFDDGAAALLRDHIAPGAPARDRVSIPDAMLQAIRSPTRGSRYKSNDRTYVCRAYVVKSPDETQREPLYVLHFDKDSSTEDAVQKAVAAYQLTNREKEVLECLSAGLSTKQVANRMKISPNTVRSYLRLIMIKMEAPSRAGIIAKLLELNNGNGRDETEGTQRGRRVRSRRKKGSDALSTAAGMP